MTLLALLACASSSPSAQQLAAWGGLDHDGTLVAAVFAGPELLLAASYVNGLVVQRDAIPETWDLGAPVPAGQAVLTTRDPGGELEVARPSTREAVVIFRDAGEWRFDCFVDEEGPLCEAW